jgi:Flp pilus assembly protein TadB
MFAQPASFERHRGHAGHCAGFSFEATSELSAAPILQQTVSACATLLLKLFRMKEKSRDGLRRTLGALFLLVAVGMVVLGLASRLSDLQGGAFLRYWSVCWAFTMLAMIFALWDLRIIRARAREEKRRLVEDAVKTFEREAKKPGVERDGD